MDITARTKYVRMSPQKAMDLARAIAGKPVPVALQLAQFSERKAGFEIGKTLKSAIANAENNHELSADALWVKQCVIEEGPRLKRFWPRSRGMASPVLKRMSHVRVVLTDHKAAK